MPPLAVVIPALLAAGAALWEWLKPENDPAWSEKSVFNDRMRQIQSNMADLNRAFAACPDFMKNAQHLGAWRAFKLNWSKYYAEVGRLTVMGPNTAQIENGKLYCSQLAKWIDVLKSLPSCVNVSVTPPPATSTKPGASIFDQISGTAWAVGGAAVLVILLLGSSKR